MKTLALELTAANVTALDYDLRQALTTHFFGLTYDGKQVTLVLDDAVTQNDVRQAQTIVATHDPAKLTPDQQASSSPIDHTDTDDCDDTSDNLQCEIAEFAAFYDEGVL